MARIVNGDGPFLNPQPGFQESVSIIYTLRGDGRCLATALLASPKLGVFLPFYLAETST